LESLRQAAFETSHHYVVERMVDSYIQAFHQVSAPTFARSHRPAPGPYPVMQSCRSRYPFWLRKLKQHLLVATVSQVWARLLHARVCPTAGVAYDEARMLSGRPDSIVQKGGPT
jgi:hypothetical protein